MHSGHTRRSRKAGAGGGGLRIIGDWALGADIAEIKPGDTVAVFGCEPVGLFAIIRARLLGAGRVFAVDTLPDRLEKAREMGPRPSTSTSRVRSSV